MKMKSERFDGSFKNLRGLEVWKRREGRKKMEVFEMSF